ncbi:ena/VASP-like protein [Hetaerina americana]|uniref:ena/VASP-like protein n=1 Tax=Hetaerina americana TaxID=62018 RepID=UPI003A7F1A74
MPESLCQLWLRALSDLRRVLVDRGGGGGGGSGDPEAPGRIGGDSGGCIPCTPGLARPPPPFIPRAPTHTLSWRQPHVASQPTSPSSTSTSPPPPSPTNFDPSPPPHTSPTSPTYPCPPAPLAAGGSDGDLNPRARVFRRAAAAAALLLAKFPRGEGTSPHAGDGEHSGHDEGGEVSRPHVSQIAIPESPRPRPSSSSLRRFSRRSSSRGQMSTPPTMNDIPPPGEAESPVAAGSSPRIPPPPPW